MHDQVQGGIDDASLLQHGVTGFFVMQVTFFDLQQLTEQTRQMNFVTTAAACCRTHAILLPRTFVALQE